MLSKNKLELLQEKGQVALFSRQYHLYYDQGTYLSEKLFEGFKASKNQKAFLKLIWAFGVGWDCNPVELAKICPDVCPIFKTPLDYGRGLNRILNPNVDSDEGFFQPTVDHIIPRSLGGEDSISNYVIVSRKANQFKSDMNSQEELDNFYNGMKTVYFGKTGS
jgi:hypothetical protein